jgi:hypothetical protein
MRGVRYTGEDFPADIAVSRGGSRVYVTGDITTHIEGSGEETFTDYGTVAHRASSGAQLAAVSFGGQRSNERAAGMGSARTDRGCM